MKEELLKTLMDIRSQISMSGIYVDLLDSCESNLINLCHIIDMIDDSVPKQILKRELDKLEEMFKWRAGLKLRVAEFESTRNVLSSFLDLKYWELERVRSMYYLIEKGKAKTLQEAIALTE